MSEEKKNIRKEFVVRVYIVYFGVMLFGIAILLRILDLQVVQGSHWRSKADSMSTELRNIEAVRGNIYSDDGSLMATSSPSYEIRLDVGTPSITKTIWDENVDGLASAFADLFKDRTKNEYLRDLKIAQTEHDRYHLIQREVSFDKVRELNALSYFKKGKFKNGLITIQKNLREKPLEQLASRTIGYPPSEGRTAVGIEGAFDSILAGVSGKRLEQKIAGGIWKPLRDANSIEPQDGHDVISTIDKNIQDVAENALKNSLIKNKAESGCVIIMEVATGEVRAIANLRRQTDGTYEEVLNYAISEATEPGSTFKLISMIAAMDDGLVDLNDSVNTTGGVTKYFNQVMKDSHEGGYGRITAQRAFELSSNVGISKLIYGAYAKNPEAFIDHLYKMKVNEPLNLQISGETAPDIKSVKDPRWSGVSLPWMAIGYELRMTPLQQLTFYNAVANNGKMVKPLLVKEIRDKGKILKHFDPIVICDSICSAKTLVKARKMLEGVVERGTGTTIRDTLVRIAGKTGTAQRSLGTTGYKSTENKVSYQASFAGYFPAEAPVYSGIVVVYSPSTEVYYGGSVSAPVFREIADQVYASRIEMHKELTASYVPGREYIPKIKFGFQRDLEKVYTQLGFTATTANPAADWAQVVPQNNNMTLLESKVAKNIVPNVVGMGIKDALYLLENAGLNVRFRGRGLIIKQSIGAGTGIISGTEIILELG